MRKITNYNIDDEFYQPTQIDLGTAEKEDTQPIETPKNSAISSYVFFRISNSSIFLISICGNVY